MPLALYDVPAPAKLNLFLHVVGKRPDGYHLLQSIFALIDWADTLHFERRSDGQLARHDGDHAAAALPADDLCLRAARLLQTESGCGFGADIHLEKRLPAGAGMGGGSSDAASTLLALNRLWGLNWPRSRLLPLGLRLGADVPFFLGGHNAFVEGIGEVLHPIPLRPQGFVVIKPSAGISTQELFSSPLLASSKSAAIVAGFPAHNSKGLKPVAEVSNPDFDGAVWMQSGFGRNDLQKPAESKCEQIVRALKILDTRFGNSRMTGSGSAVFATVDIDDDEESGISGISEQTALKFLMLQEELPSGWSARICRSLKIHPLSGWVED